MSGLLSKCPSCGRWFGLRQEGEQVVASEDVVERVPRYPVRRYRSVAEVLAAETIEKTVRYTCKLEKQRKCRNCGARSVAHSVRADRRAVVQLPSSKVVEPFGEVNVWSQPDGSVRVRATILMVPSVAGARTGLAIDGSASMKDAFGGSGALPTLFARSSPNIVEPVARTLGGYLAKFSSNGKTNVIYWACGTGGAQVQELGEIDAASARTKTFPPPRQYGVGTKLLPAVKFFTETKYSNSPWSIFVIVTNGIVDDLADVQQYSLALAKQLASGRRGFLKLVLVGVGADVDEGQMEALDDLDYGGLKMPGGDPIDLWDHKLASEMRMVEEIFAEVVSDRVLLAPTAEVLDNDGRPVQPTGRVSYKDGLPALLDFRMPAGASVFTLVLPGGKRVVQRVK